MKRRSRFALLVAIVLPVLSAGCSAGGIPAPDVRLCVFVALFGTVLVEVRRHIGPF
jgi:hypothetical protein